MSKRRSKFLLVGCLVLMGPLAWLLFLHPQEPSYQDRSLSSWLNDVGNPGGVMLAREGVAIDAVRQMGPEAYPFLLSMLKAEDGPARKFILAKLGKQRSMKMGLLPADEKYLRAKTILTALRTDAEVAWKQILLDPTFAQQLRLSATSWCQVLPEDAPRMVPAMIRLMTELQPDQREPVRWSIRRFGPEVAVPILVRQLQDPDRNVRLIAMRTLRSFEERARSAVPALEQQLRSFDPEFGLAAADTLLTLDARNVPALVYRAYQGDLSQRTSAYWVLAREKQSALTALPALMQGLTNGEPEIRQAALAGLARCGTNARPALPALTNLLNVTYFHVEASNAIKSITAQR